MGLTSRLTLPGTSASEPEDFLSSSLDLFFPDNVMNQHGDEAGHGLVWTSPHLPKPLQIFLADPKAEQDRALFGHYLWNASLLMAELVEAGTLEVPFETGGTDDQTVSSLAPPVSDFGVRDLSIIELGAGTALPSLVAALLGARRVLVTDYPAPDILRTLERNVALNVRPENAPSGRLAGEPVQVLGHSWGELDEPWARESRHAFDRVFVADCLWMPWQHDNLSRSIEWFLGSGPDARAWVIAGFHTGREKMRGFFEVASLAARGLEVDRIWEQDCNGEKRPWAWDRGVEDTAHRMRWLVVAILRRCAQPATPESATSS